MDFFKRRESFVVEPVPEGSSPLGDGSFLDCVFEGSFAEAIKKATQISDNLRLLDSIIASPQ